ncbi:hypothetical protein PENSPDRAFT_504149 [Peniophora sp. CONT]|nr:hypothetical protein PENSPDRAFT_504149 [Peniophora sp. CONT]
MGRERLRPFTACRLAFLLLPSMGRVMILYQIYEVCNRCGMLAVLHVVLVLLSTLRALVRRQPTNIDPSSSATLAQRRSLSSAVVVLQILVRRRIGKCPRRLCTQIRIRSDGVYHVHAVSKHNRQIVVWST